MKTDTVRARIDPELKRESEQVFDNLGLTTTEAIRLFFYQVKLRKGLSFTLTLPDADIETEDILHPSKKRNEALDLIDGD